MKDTTKITALSIITLSSWCVFYALSANRWHNKYQAEHALHEACGRNHLFTNSLIKWETNYETQFDKWTTYTYGQGVTNGVVAAVSSMTDYVIRAKAGEPVTGEGVTNAIFGSISNAMSQDKFKYFDARVLSDSK